MAIGIMRNGVPLDQLYAPKGTSTAAATGCMQNGVDVNQYILALADGHALGFNAGIAKNGTDFSSFFGVPNGNTPLPINGNTYTHVYTVPSASTGFATIGFRIVSGTTWQVWYADPTTSATVITSGTVPSGSSTVKFTWGTPSVLPGDTDAGGSVTNGASTATAISGNPGTNYTTATVGSSSGSRSRSYPFTIDFYNASSVDISTTNITLVGQTEGSV